LSESQKPQFILTMTTTNHPPYQIPESYTPTSLEPPPEISSRLIADKTLAKSRFQAFQYSNQKLAEFLSKVKNSPLAENLIIAITGDHSFWMVQFSDEELFDKWGVPFYIYVPKAIKEKTNGYPRETVYGSHVDILPTLYNLALSEAEYDALGNNLFAPLTTDQQHYSLFSGETIVNQKHGIRLSQSGFKSFDWQGRKMVSSAETAEHLFLAKKYKSLMAITDYYFMIEKKSAKALIK
jgi:phosphoglycerol transferase MdoB-like AlkP superfamily enzyme